MPRRDNFESFQKHLGEIADVSLTLETFPFCKYPSLLDNLRNRNQEAEGSIPFISTISLRIFCYRAAKNRLRGKRFSFRRPRRP